jgi:hypothetical protein
MTSLEGTDGGTGYGVLGSSSSAAGVEGIVGGQRAVVSAPGIPPVQAGVVGYGYDVGPDASIGASSAVTYGVYGTSISGGDGVYGSGENGVHGSSGVPSGYGVLGEHTSGTGVRGVTGAGSGHPQGPTLAGVWGDSTDGNGVYGSSASWNGVEGDSWSPAHAGIVGQNNAGGPAVLGYSTGNAGQFEGNCLVTGTHTVGVDLVLQNPAAQDCAEDFDVIEPGLTGGTVVVMGEQGSVRSCDSEYSTAVVGIISGAGGLRPGITLGRRSSSTPRMPVALFGKVYCKVDATYSPINVGDLLTTSRTHGHAMRASDPSRAFGSVIGKALAELADGCGMIPVLVALQ